MNDCPPVVPGFQFESEGTLHVGYFTGNGIEGPGYYYVNYVTNKQIFGNPIPTYIQITFLLHIQT